MEFEQAFHEHWGDCVELESVLPVARLTTGRTRDAVFPYATLEVRSVRSELPTNRGPALTALAVRVNLWHNRHADAKALAKQVKEAFDGTQFVLSGSIYVARMRHVSDSIRQHDDGAWQWAVDFEARVYSVP